MAKKQRYLTTLGNDELRRLTECESIISKGRAAFVEVGRALAEIRDSSLYRASHKTFEGYCQERWGFGRRYAGMLIQGVKVVARIGAEVEVENGNPGSQSLPKLPPIENEKQARELAAAPEELQREAWSEATKETPKPTAKKVRESVGRVVAKKKSEPKPKVEIDPDNPPLTDKVREALDQVEVFRELQARVQSLRKDLAALCDTRLGKFLTAQQIDADLKNVWNQLKFGTPCAPCHLCAQRGCTACKRDGWLCVGIKDRVAKEQLA